MGDFNKTVITSRGLALIAKAEASQAVISFTDIKTTNTVYTAGELEGLTALSNIKNTALVSSVSYVEPSSVKISAAIIGNVSEGYYLQTLGVYALDPNEGEILFAVTTAKSADWIPPISTSSFSIAINQYIAVGNANVNLTIDHSATLTAGDLESFKVILTDELNAHILARVTDASGVHGIRYSNNELQVYNGNWQSILNEVVSVPIYQVVDSRADKLSFTTMRGVSPLGSNLGAITILTDKTTADGSFEMAAPMNMHKVDWDGQARDTYRAYLGTRLAVYDVITIGGEYIYMPYSGFNHTLANSTGNDVFPRNCNAEIYSSLIWSEIDGVRTNYAEKPIRYAEYFGGGKEKVPATKTMTAYSGAVWTSDNEAARLDVCGNLKIPLVSSPIANTKYCHRFYFYCWDNMATLAGNGTHWPVYSYYKIGQLAYTRQGNTIRLAPTIKGYYNGR